MGYKTYIKTENYRGYTIKFYEDDSGFIDTTVKNKKGDVIHYSIITSNIDTSFKEHKNFIDKLIGDKPKTSSEIIEEKIQKHLKKVDGGYYNILEVYNDNSVLILWGKGDKTYKKVIR